MCRTGRQNGTAVGGRAVVTAVDISEQRLDVCGKHDAVKVNAKSDHRLRRRVIIHALRKV